MMRIEPHEKHHEGPRVGRTYRAARPRTYRVDAAECARGAGAGFRRGDVAEAREGDSGAWGWRLQAARSDRSIGDWGAALSSCLCPPGGRHGGAGTGARRFCTRAPQADGSAEKGWACAKCRAAQSDPVLSQNRLVIERLLRRRRPRTAREVRCRRARPGSSSSRK
jgi:hypothetical protein